jgi:hypothetical protein
LACLSSLRLSRLCGAFWFCLFAFNWTPLAFSLTPALSRWEREKCSPPQAAVSGELANG